MGTSADYLVARANGAEGQLESLCSAFGPPAIHGDVWFEWTATADGCARIEASGHTGIDADDLAGGLAAGSVPLL